MKNLILLVATLLAAGAAQASTADENMKSMHASKGKMDANGDSMVSKEEFMKAHEAMFDRMKGPNGMISLKDMEKHHQGMMKHGDMKGHGSMRDNDHPHHGNPSSGMK